MKRIVEVAVLMVLSCMLALAQNTPAQGGMTQDKGQPMSGMQGMEKMRTMHEQMMKDMQTDLDAMKATLGQMKGQLSKVSDSSVHQQLQWNVDLWQKMLDNMDKHMAIMKQMMESHQDMMMHHKAMMKSRASPQSQPPPK